MAYSKNHFFIVNCCYEILNDMEKKEFYQHYLPHFQQPGQAYFVTWCLKDAVPAKALLAYTQKLNLLKSQILSLGSANSDSPIIIKNNIEMNAIQSYEAVSKTLDNEFSGPFLPEIVKLKKEYNTIRGKYFKAYDNLLDTERNPIINLSKPENREIVIESLKFWEGKKLNNCAFTIMNNHIHWVFELFEKDQEGKPVYLQDLLQSVKRFSANQINKLENRQGSLWQKESFDTTIRNEEHMYHAINYTLNNPVTAGLVHDWKLWPGTWCGSADF